MYRNKQNRRYLVANCSLGLQTKEVIFHTTESRESNREKFLENLKGNKTRYKQYRSSPIRYAGGKSRAVGHIIQYFPTDIDQIVSPFFGGGSVEIALANEIGFLVYGFDIFNMLTNYWQWQLSSPDMLFKHLKNINLSKENYKKIKQYLKNIWESNKENILESEESDKIAAYYWFNHNLSYGPAFLGWMSKIYENRTRYDKMIDKLRKFKCPNLAGVYLCDFEETLTSFPNSFLYCDPHYYLDEGKMFKGIYPQRNFPVHHKNFDHIKLANILNNHKSGFILSYNDCNTIRELYKKHKIVEVKWQYTMGQGETRIGKNRIERGDTHIKESHEILILGY